MAMLVLFATAFAIAGGLVMTIVAWAARNRMAAVRRLAGVVVLAAAYGIALVVVSLLSTVQRLAPGAEKRFCGAYLDCHMAASVAGVETTTAIGTGPDAVRASGRFWIVAVRLSSNAMRATITAREPGITAIDDHGARFAPSPEATRALAAARGAQPALAGLIPPDGEHRTLVVFDLPAATTAPTLHVTDSNLGPDVSEFFLIGDEDSLLHKPILLSLTPIKPIT